MVQGQVNFKTPQVRGFFSQHDHFEYSQIAVKQDVQEEEEALVTGDYWQVDGLRRELIRERRALEGKTMYKIKEDYVIPDDVIRSDLDRAKPFRGNIDDLFHPESASSAPSGVQKKPGSLQKEAGKPISRGPSLKKIEVGPPAAKRHVGKQKPKIVDDSQGGSSRKKVVVSYPKLDEEDKLDKKARELGLEKDDSDEPQVIEFKSSAPARVRGKQDSEKSTQETR